MGNWVHKYNSAVQCTSTSRCWTLVLSTHSSRVYVFVLLRPFFVLLHSRCIIFHASNFYSRLKLFSVGFLLHFWLIFELFTFGSVWMNFSRFFPEGLFDHFGDWGMFFHDLCDYFEIFGGIFWDELVIGFDFNGILSVFVAEVLIIISSSEIRLFLVSNFFTGIFR